MRKISHFTVHIPSLFYFCVDDKNDGMTVADFINLLQEDPLRPDVEEILTNICRYQNTPRPSGALWEKTKREVLLRDNNTCVYCGENSGFMEIDHIIPFSLGGSNERDNLATSCLNCNRRKGSKTVEEWKKGEQ
jgi:hypothetical protein